MDVQYQVSFGDIDIGLFRESTDPETSEKIPTRIRQDVNTVSNACIAETLGPGTYYGAVRGAPLQAGDYNMATAFSINSYRIRIYALAPTNPAGCTVATGDMK
jgi:hypothetical protein